MQGHARHRAAHPGRTRRLYALLIALVMTGAFGLQLWRNAGSDGDLSPSKESAVQSSQTGATVHQRTVATIIGPDAIRVVEHLTFTSPADTVALVNSGHVGAASAFAPEIDNLWIDAGAGPAPVPGKQASSEVVRLALPLPATEVTVGYRATGVVERTENSAPGRALALVTPLRLAQVTGLRAVEVRGVWVDNLGCVDQAGRMSACGRGTSLGWETGPEDAQLVDVVAQLTLPSG